ncbi:MAG: DUF4190 domain-containing protein [Candidatus Hydrogenedentes bacterium]|nr:DUF4190 domain-containing protein [Candidatus Hydrogenedentota bacterium]
MSSQPSRISGMAIASFVLALLFCPFLLLASVPAIILGHVAHSKIRASNGQLRGSGLAIAGFTIGYLGIAFTIFILPAIMLPALARAREAARASSCQNNLKQIGICNAMYAGEHGGAFPANLQALYPEYMSELSVFVCPSDITEIGDSASINAWTSYEYIPGATEESGATVAVCRDNDHIHLRGMRNVLYADGHVERTTE